MKNWKLLKNLKLGQTLNATVYPLEIKNELWNFKTIISSIEYGFESLVWTQSDCSKKAIMFHKCSNDAPAELYCEQHLYLVDLYKEGEKNLDNELKNSKSMLNYLKKLLIVVQGQMEFLKIENSNKDMNAYNKIKERLEEENESLKNTLENMTEKAKHIASEEETKK